MVLLSPHRIDAQSGACTLFGTPHISPALVALGSVANRSIVKKGAPIHVTLTLRAGPDGVYLPDFFGSFFDTCSHGFATEVLTLQGKPATPGGRGCGSSGPNPKIRYVKLKPGEVRSWNTDLPTKSIAPGQYCLNAEYLIAEELMSYSVNLPEDKTLVAKGRITATPIRILVR